MFDPFNTLTLEQVKSKSLLELSMINSLLGVVLTDNRDEIALYAPKLAQFVEHVSEELFNRRQLLTPLVRDEEEDIELMSADLWVRAPYSAAMEEAIRQIVGPDTTITYREANEENGDQPGEPGSFLIQSTID